MTKCRLWFFSSFLSRTCATLTQRKHSGSACKLVFLNVFLKQSCQRRHTIRRSMIGQRERKKRNRSVRRTTLTTVAERAQRSGVRPHISHTLTTRDSQLNEPPPYREARNCRRGKRKERGKAQNSNAVARTRQPLLRGARRYSGVKTAPPNLVEQVPANAAERVERSEALPSGRSERTTTEKKQQTSAAAARQHSV